MTESEALAETVSIAPKYPIAVVEESGGHRAFAVDFPNAISHDACPAKARGLAYHYIFQAVKRRLIKGSELILLCKSLPLRKAAFHCIPLHRRLSM
jgi:hypothetical protein